MALNMPHKTYISNRVQSASIQIIEMCVLEWDSLYAQGTPGME